MKFVLVTIALTSALVWAQGTKDPGRASKYAGVGKKSGSSSLNTAPKTEPLAAQLARIEQQGAHVPSSSAGNHPVASAKPVFPKTPPPQSKNKPMKFTPKAQPRHYGQAH